MWEQHCCCCCCCKMHIVFFYFLLRNKITGACNNFRKNQDVRLQKKILFCTCSLMSELLFSCFSFPHFRSQLSSNNSVEQCRCDACKMHGKFFLSIHVHIFCVRLPAHKTTTHVLLLISSPVRKEVIFSPATQDNN